MIRKTERKLGLASGLLLSTAAVAFAVLPSPVRAQGWTTELSDVAKNAPQARKRRDKPAAAAAKGKTRPETAKAAVVIPAKAEPPKAEAITAPVAATAEPAKTEPVKAEPVKAEPVAA